MLVISGIFRLSDPVHNKILLDILFVPLNTTVYVLSV